MSGRQRARGLSVAALTLALLVAASRGHAFTCEATDGMGCPLPGSTCFASCDEADLRSVIALTNGCPANPEGDEVTIAMGPDLATTCGTVPIPLAMAPTAPAVATGACGDDNANRYNALCLAGTGVILDGRAAIFTYSGDQICASCDGECTVCPTGPCANRQPALAVLRGARNTVRNLEMRFFPEGIQISQGDGHVVERVTGPCANRQPALVVLRGARNTVRNLEMRFFPEGIQISQGDGHVVERVTGRYVCEDAVSVNGGTGHRIADNVLAGTTDGVTGGGTCYVRVEGTSCTGDGNCPAGARCYCGEVSRFGSCATPSPPPIWPAATPGQCYRPARCGLDKAIQVNGGESRIERNRIDRLQQPVHVDAGTHTIADNLTCGSHVDPNACQAYDVSGGAVTLARNRIDRCKFGIRVVDAGAADAVDNVITNGWVSAFQVKGTGGAALRGVGNRVRNAGAFTGSDCQRGALVVIGDPAARVDFGGGDASGAAVFGGERSPGGNVFCQRQSDGSSLAHVWNVTDCACALNPSCSCSMASDAVCGSMCPFAAPCCRLEADGACQGSLGQDASVGVGSAVAANAFDPPPVVFPATPPNLVDRMPIRTRIENATPFAICHTIVVDECECLGRPDGAACNDADACSAVDVCIAGICIGTQRPVCNASDQCHVAGICDPLSGTCSDPARPDGSACEDGAPCTAGDTCQAGICTGGGPGPDRDADGICDGLDICPDAADPTQPDLDGDGSGDACDVVDAPLDLTRALLRRRGSRGTAAVRGSFVVQSAGDAFAAASAIAVRIRNGSAVDEERVWAADDCRADESRVVCKAKTARGRFVLGENDTWRFRIKLAQVAIEREFDASVAVVLTHGAHLDRVGSLTASACKQKRTRLRCRL